MKWFLGSDHGGLALKRHLKSVLEGLGDEVEDLGCHSEESSDYPDFAARVGRKVAAGEGLGLLCCGTGIGMAMSANKVAGVRAAVVTDAFTAQVTREHNDANVMCVGQRVIGSGVAETALRAFRAARFAGGRHQRRVDKLIALESGRPLPQGGKDPGTSE
jgi:ribose 5-phosphate isomerase B